MGRPKLSQAFAAALKKRRIAKGFTQEFLAEKADLHTTYVSMLERRLRNPTVDVAEALAKALGITASEMIADAEKIQKRDAK